MDINTESLFLKSENLFFQDTARGECKTDIDSNEVGKVLGVYVKGSDCDGEIVDSKIKYNSNIIYSICYTDKQNNIKKCEMIGSIAGEMLNVDSTGYLQVDVKCEKVETDVSSLKVIIRAVFTVRATITEQKKCDFVSQSNDLIIKKQDVEYYKSYGKRKTVFPIEEEFSLGYCISNVLMHKTVSYITAVQCGVGCIIVDGETHISALLLQNNEKKDIIREEKIIPFRAEIEYDEAMPVMMAQVEVKEKSFKTDISVDEEKNLSLVKVSLSLILEGEAFSENESIISVDAFSLTSEIDRQIAIVEKVKPLEQCYFVKEIVGENIAVDLPENSLLLAVGFESVELSNIRQNGDNLEIEGVVSFTAFFKNENEVINRKLESSFNTSLALSQNEQSNYIVDGKIISISASLVMGKEVSAKYSLEFSVLGSKSEKIELLTAVTENGEKQAKTSSISVYIALPNEDLWSLAKRLNTPPEDICEINKELQFPLTGKERIIVYRQKK